MISFKVNRFYLFLINLFILFLSLILAVFLRFPNIFLSQFKIHFLKFLPIFFFYFLLGYLFKIFHIEKFLSFKEFIKSFLKNLILNFLISFVYFYLFVKDLAPKKVLFVFWIFIFIFSILILRKYSNYFYKKRPEINLILYGKKNYFERLKKDIENNPQFKFKILFSNNIEKIKKIQDPKIIILPKSSFFRKFFNKNDLLTKTVNITKFYEEIFGILPLEYLSEEEISDFISKDRRFYDFFKRVIDIIFGLFLSVLTLILFPFIALGIKISSPGPIFFKQKRIGFNNKEITIIKFRTLHEAKTGWIKRDDDAIFKFGKFLRMFHLDELPQGFLILKGDLSIVGPRPEQVELVKELEKEIPYYFLRHLIKPGITGWAQIHLGKENIQSIDFTKRKLEYDLYYLKNQSIFLDLVIIFNTLRAVFEVSKHY